MSVLSSALADYLALRRSLGTELRAPALLLRRFVEFADREGAPVVTTELALRWAPLRALARRHRSPHRGSARGAPARPLPPVPALSVPRRGGRGARRGGRPPPVAAGAARADLRHALRPAGCHGSARQ